MPINKPDMRNPVLLLAFGFGSGLSPKAPGTFGSLAALPFFLLLGGLPLPLFLLVVGLVSVAGIWICGRAATLMGVHDHGGIVLDEFAGQWLTLLPLVPVSNWSLATGLWVLLGFALFRLFDILKPWPIRWFDENVHGGLGIMVDDIAAAVPAVLETTSVPPATLIVLL